ncbi:MAG: hypothetical protein O7E57_05985, partial [Gammaproteobacteria bacterium]|nr:hypothetical protein [Gammaproteobacteria bacterium]
MTKRNDRVLAVVLLVVTGMMGLAGCSKDNPVSVDESVFTGATRSLGSPQVSSSKPQQPDGLVELVWDRKKLKFWPYTGTNF